MVYYYILTNLGYTNCHKVVQQQLERSAPGLVVKEVANISNFPSTTSAVLRDSK
jgi:hypothetical protein